MRLSTQVLKSILERGVSELSDSNGAMIANVVE